MPLPFSGYGFGKRVSQVLVIMFLALGWLGILADTAIASAASSTPPAVVATDPALGAFGALVTAAPTVTFSTALDPASVTSDSLQLRRLADNSAVTTTLVLEADNTRVRLTPPAALSYGTSYYYWVGRGLKSNAGVQLEDTWYASAKERHQFTTEFLNSYISQTPGDPAPPVTIGASQAPVANFRLSAFGESFRFSSFYVSSTVAGGRGTMRNVTLRLRGTALGTPIPILPGDAAAQAGWGDFGNALVLQPGESTLLAVTADFTDPNWRGGEAITVSIFGFNNVFGLISQRTFSALRQNSDPVLVTRAGAQGALFTSIQPATSSLALAWEAGGGSETEFLLALSAAGPVAVTSTTGSPFIASVSTMVAIVPVGASLSYRHTFADLTPNTPYWYAVAAHDAVGPTPPATSTITVTSVVNSPIYTLANPPRDLAARVVSSSTITLSWQGDASGYYVFNETASTTSEWAPESSFTFSGLACGTTYSFTVKGRNAEKAETKAVGPVAARTLDCSPALVKENLSDNTVPRRGQAFFVGGGISAPAPAAPVAPLAVAPASGAIPSAGALAVNPGPTATPALAPQVLGEKISRVNELIGTLRPGARGAAVVALQRDLQARGLMPLSWKVTAYYGAVTARAVDQYLISKSVTAGELASLRRRGDRGKAVGRLQRELKQRGFFPARVPATGYFGPITAAAVKQYQVALP